MMPMELLMTHPYSINYANAACRSPIFADCVLLALLAVLAVLTHGHRYRIP